MLGVAGTLLADAPSLKVDRYGQYTGEDWPGKVTCDEQLRAEAAREWPLIRDAGFDPARFDRFGGRLDAGDFEARRRDTAASSSAATRSVIVKAVTHLR